MKATLRFLPWLVPLPALAAWMLVLLAGGPPARADLGGIPLIGDKASLVFLLFLAFLGVQVQRFAARSMKGDPRRTRFLLVLAATLWAAQGLAAAGHLALFLFFWVLISTGLHMLLRHFRKRAGAVIVAREKFLISRIGDVALLLAGGLLLSGGTSLRFEDWLRLAPTVTVFAALLLVVGALTKSAQVPFHSWLPRTLDAPTAVSALMHAGIINGGGYLLIRAFPLVSASEEALCLLLVAGTVSALWGLLSMMVQADIKRRLAWSTVAQMGFMMVEIGAGLPGLALLHLVGHGLYKAQGFLASGVIMKPLPFTRAPSLARSLGAAGLWALLSIAGYAAAAGLTRHGIVEVLAAVLLLPLFHSAFLLPRGRQVVGMAVSAVALAAASFLLGLGAQRWLGLADRLPESGIRFWILGLAAAALLVPGLMSVFHPWLRRAGLYARLHASALHGFGLGRWPEALAERLGPIAGGR